MYGTTQPTWGCILSKSKCQFFQWLPVVCQDVLRRRVPTSTQSYVSFKWCKVDICMHSWWKRVLVTEVQGTVYRTSVPLMHQSHLLSRLHLWYCLLPRMRSTWVGPVAVDTAWQSADLNDEEAYIHTKARARAWTTHIHTSIFPLRAHRWILTGSFCVTDTCCHSLTSLIHSMY